MELILRGTVFGVEDRKSGSNDRTNARTGEVTTQFYDSTNVGFLDGLDVVKVKIDHLVPGVPGVPAAGDEVEWVVKVTPYRNDNGRAVLSIKALAEASVPARAV